MLKLAIYGDSFTDPVTLLSDIPLVAEIAWVNLLKRDYDTVTYGLGGSSVYYSYSIFKNTHHNYDKIIFLITSPDRWPVPLEHLDYSTFIPGLHAVEGRIKDLKCWDIRTQIKLRPKLFALRNFYHYLFSEKMAKAMQEWNDLMVADIKRERPDTVFVTYDTMVFKYMAAFQDQVPGFPNHLRLSSVGVYSEYIDFRTACHFSEEVNNIVYNDAKKALETGTWNVNIPDVIPHSHHFDYYFKKS